MNRYKFHPEALEEYRQAVVYYEDRRENLGSKFIESIEQIIYEILKSPERWPLIKDQVRKNRTRKFPYSVLYVVRDDHILILAVMHSSRDPDYWLHRQANS